MNKTPRFLDLLHAGEVTPEQIDDFIEVWHTENPPVQLHVFLGMTWLEYRSWAKECWLPTAAEHALERADVLWSRTPGVEEPELIRVHSPVRCRPPCPVHWPSEHPLAAAAMHWDAEQGIIQRICDHELLHPDPDDQQVRLHEELRDHRCDGCCSPAAFIDGEFYEQDEPLPEVLRAFSSATRRGITRRPR